MSYLTLIFPAQFLVFWLQSYLSDHSQQVVIDGYSSTKPHVSSGVPQGSILGPLLFIIYMNNLSFLSLISNASLTLYADDITHSQEIYSSSCMLSVQSNINLNCVLDILTLSVCQQLTKRLKYMIISRKRSSFDSFPCLFLNNIILERVFTFKYLDVLISCDLSWSPHI